MTSQIAKIKKDFKSFGFYANEISARVIKNKYGENIGTSIRLKKSYRSDLMDKVVRLAPQIAKAGYNVDIIFYHSKVLYIGIKQAPYGKRGMIDYGQCLIEIEKIAKQMGLE